MTVKEFIRAVESAYKQKFPKGEIDSRFKASGFGGGITFYFGVQSKSDWINNIFHNDPSASTVMIHGDFGGDEMPEKIDADMALGGTLLVAPTNPHKAFDRVKIGWRKKSGSPEQIIKHMSNYFAKMRQVVNNNRDNLKHKVANENVSREFIARELIKIAKDLMTEEI